jgi:uncharacterized RDD family membrane protein YckC
MTAEISRHGRATEFLEGRAQARRRIGVTTPEGVALFFELADPGERLTAFMIDWVLWGVATVVIYLVLVFVVFAAFAVKNEVGIAVTMSIMLFLTFLVRNLYFIHFELAWQGSTPGKRIVGLRVIDRKGGPLTPIAVIARNLTREVEAFIPLGMLLSIGAVTGFWSHLSLVVWILLFSALPLFNRDRMRAGDLIAGTVVVALPKRILLGDLVDECVGHVFPERYLGAYGAFELQILEDLLRRPNAPDSARLRRDVCAKIRLKIGWTDPVAEADTERFLMDFYAAQRAHLERAQLYGKYRADKHDAAGVARPGA